MIIFPLSYNYIGALGVAKRTAKVNKDILRCLQWKIKYPCHYTQKAIQDLKGTNDRLYMIGLGGVGAGVAGIIIAATALSHRRVLEV